MLGNISHCLDYRDRKVTVDLVGKSEGGRVFIYYYAQDNFLNQKKKIIWTKIGRVLRL